MTFLNWAMLAGLGALAVPILIHLLNRRHAKLIDWGAMQFLMASLTTRKRNIMIEEVILMAIRCMLLALIVLAMARPFLPSRSSIPWAVVLPSVLGAVLAVGIASAVWTYARARWLLLWLAAILLAIAGFSTAMEHWTQSRMWASAGGEKDVVIVIDASTSMTMEVDGKTNFQRAVAEARAVIDECRPGDAIGLILAGSAPREIIANPTSDREQLKAALEDLKPTGGAMKVLKALNAATASLEEGHNPGKKIVLLTDGQKIGWDLGNDSSWSFLAAGLNAMPSKPQIICRMLKLPKKIRNLAVTDLTLARQVIGTDRPVRINVKVANTGTEKIAAAAVKLSIDDKSLPDQRVEDLPKGSAETVHFDYRFRRPGPHVLTARVLSKDAMGGDNISRRTVNVIERLGVLIIDGSPGQKKLCGANLIKMALAPGGPKRGGTNRPGRQRGKGGEIIIDPDVVKATRIRSARDLHQQFRYLSQYALIILSEVPRLPKSVRLELLSFVRRGGGLLIVPGEFAQMRDRDKAAPSLYSEWKTETGQQVAPASLVQRITSIEEPARAALKTFSHPALAVVGDPGDSDMSKLRIKSYWKLAANEKDPSVRVAGLMNTGDPLLVERKITKAKGYVLMTAWSMDLRDSNLPQRKCFLPLLHELSYFLAAPVMVNANVQPGTEVVLRLRPRQDSPAKIGQDRKAKVMTPSGRSEMASLSDEEGMLRIRFNNTAEPGTYLVELPKALAGRYPAMASAPGVENIVPFVVLRDPAESRFQKLGDKEIKQANEYVNLRQADTYDELIAAISGGIPGEELWRWLALAALLAIVAEIALTRWIAMRRKSHVDEQVEFGDESEDLETLRLRARELLAGPAQQARAVSK